VNDEATGQGLNIRQKIGYLMLCVLPGYFIEHIKRFAQKKKIPSLLRFINMIERIWSVLDLLNFLAFINGSLYVNIPLRILEFRYQILDQNRLRWIDYDYLNRTVIWREISEFFIHVLPILGSLAPLLKKLFFFTTLLGPLSVNLDSDDTKYACKDCGTNPPNIPRILEECGHIYCRSCLRDELECPM